MFPFRRRDLMLHEAYTFYLKDALSCLSKHFHFLKRAFFTVLSSILGNLQF
jgi:hypothetical protein